MSTWSNRSGVCSNLQSEFVCFENAGEKMGLPNSIPFYTQKGSVEEVVHGVNYGSSHGTILPRGPTYQSLYHQVRQVFETFQLLQLNLTQKRYDHLIRSSVFYLSFGKDDYTDIFLGNNSGVIVKYNGQGFAHILANQMAHVIKNLYNANVRKIICMGIMPLGCAPRIVFNWNNATNASDAGKPCVQEINDFALENNTILGERITRLNLELPDAHILFCDVYKGFMEIITNSELFGMTFLPSLTASYMLISFSGFLVKQTILTQIIP